MSREIRSHLSGQDRSPLIHVEDDELQSDGAPATYVVTWGLLGEVVLRFDERGEGLTDRALLAIIADRRRKRLAHSDSL